MDENGDFTQNEDWMGFIAAFYLFFPSRGGSGLDGSIRTRIEDMLQMMRLWQVSAGFGQSLKYFYRLLPSFSHSHVEPASLPVDLEPGQLWSCDML